MFDLARMLGKSLHEVEALSSHELLRWRAYARVLAQENEKPKDTAPVIDSAASLRNAFGG